MKTKPNKIVGATLLLASGTFSLSIAAAEPSPECYRSVECEGAAICVNLACVEMADAEACDDDSACDWNAACQDGYCKPVGVLCENEGGSCEYDSASSSCECANGDGFGSAAAGDVEPIPDDELYAMCVRDLNDMCDETPPDPMEICSEDEYNTCVGVLSQIYAMEENCEDAWNDSVEIDTDYTVVDKDTDWDVAVDGDTDVSGELDTEAVEDGDADEPPPEGADTDWEEIPIPGTPPDPQRAEILSPWEIAECCEEIQEAAEDPEFDLNGYIDCILSLEPDDCEGLMACDETFGGEGKGDGEDPGDIDTAGGWDLGDTELDTEARDNGGDVDADTDADADGDPDEPVDQGDVDSATEAGDGEESTDTEESLEDEDTETQVEETADDDTADDDNTGSVPADDGDGNKASGASDSSGCSVIAPARTTTLRDLITALF